MLFIDIASFPGPSFSFKSDGEKQGLVHTVCACAPITKNHGNLDISAVFYSVTLWMMTIASFNLHSKNFLQYIFTTSPGALSLRCNTVFHPLLTGKPADRTHDRMRRQCVPGHRPDLKEKLGPGNEAKLDKSSVCQRSHKFLDSSYVSPRSI